MRGYFGFIGIEAGHDCGDDNWYASNGKPVRLPRKAEGFKGFEWTAIETDGTGLTFNALTDGDPYAMYRFIGTMGDDLFEGGNTNDILFGRAGNDILVGWNGADILRGNAGDDLLVGGALNDILRGGRGNDILIGDGHDDKLVGGDGFDFLNGGSGNDTLRGGDDGDLFYLSTGHDRIRDFDVAEGDKIAVFTLGLDEQQILDALAEANRGGANTLGSAGVDFELERDGDLLITVDVVGGALATTHVRMDGELSFDLFVF